MHFYNSQKCLIFLLLLFFNDFQGRTRCAWVKRVKLLTRSFMDEYLEIYSRSSLFYVKTIKFVRISYFWGLGAGRPRTAIAVNGSFGEGGDRILNPV